MWVDEQDQKYKEKLCFSKEISTKKEIIHRATWEKSKWASGINLEEKGANQSKQKRNNESFKIK